jgi:hypothetical protein
LVLFLISNTLGSTSDDNTHDTLETSSSSDDGNNGPPPAIVHVGPPAGFLPRIRANVLLTLAFAVIFATVIGLIVFLSIWNH